MVSGRRSRIRAKSTGIRSEANHKHNAPLPTPLPGEHVWTVVAMWRLKDPTNPQMMLDMENLMTIEGPGCFECEEVYSPELAARPCRGRPPE